MSDRERLIKRRREILEKRIDFLENKISGNEYCGVSSGYLKQELSALKSLLYELDLLRNALHKVMEHI